MPKKEHHVVPNPKSGWDVEKPGAKRVSAHADTKKEAENRGRTISKNQKTELVVHNKDGKIAEKDSHGNDPKSSKG